MRDTIAGFLGALIGVYTLILIAYVVSSLVFAFGVRVPYNRYLMAVLNFLREVSEPYLRIFRRFIPMLGPLDLSPMVAILALNIIGGLLVALVAG